MLDLDKLKAEVKELGRDWMADDFYDSWNHITSQRIAEVINAAPALIAEVERLRASNTQLLAYLDRCVGVIEFNQGSHMPMHTVFLAEIRAAIAAAKEGK